MLKDRAIDINWGLSSPFDRKYCGLNGLMWNSALTELGYDTMANMALRRSEGMSNATLTWGPASSYEGLGREKFYSTNRPRPHFNDCDHHIKRGVSIPVTVAYLGYTQGLSSTYYFYPYFRFSRGCDGIDVGTVDKHIDVDLRNAQATAWSTMQPRFEGDISMFNFLMELRDFRSLLRLLRRKPLKKLRNFFVRKKRTLDPTKPIAQTYLMNEFALKPLLSDIYKITIQLQETVKDAQQKFADAGDERSSRHYSETFTEMRTDTRSAYAISREQGARIGSTLETVFTATMEYSYRYNMRTPLDAFMKYWGLYASPEAIWNAVPFTFIVDYFLGVGDAIRITSRDRNVGLSLHQYCESLCTTRSTGFYVLPDKTYCGIITDQAIDLPDLPSSDILCAGMTSSLYSRRRTQPNKGLVIPRIKMPSSKQALNLGALLRCFF